jgi:hypothetical protein
MELVGASSLESAHFEYGNLVEMTEGVSLTNNLDSQRVLLVNPFPTVDAPSITRY